MTLDAQDLITYLARGPLDAAPLKFAVVVHPWWGASKTKQPIRGLDYGDILVANPDTREIRFARDHSRPFMNGWLDRIMGGGRREGLRGGNARWLDWEAAREHIIQAAPADFDFENDCVAWFDGLAQAATFSKDLHGILKDFTQAA